MNLGEKGSGLSLISGSDHPGAKRTKSCNLEPLQLEEACETATGFRSSPCIGLAGLCTAGRNETRLRALIASNFNRGDRGSREDEGEVEDPGLTSPENNGPGPPKIAVPRITSPGSLAAKNGHEKPLFHPTRRRM